MTTEELLAIGLTDEQAGQVFALRGKEVDQYKKSAEQYKADLDTLRGTLAQREKDLETLRQSADDIDGLRTQLEELQQKYTTDTKAYQKQIADRDYSAAITKAIADNNIRFSSKAAERAYLADLQTNRLEMQDGALVGFEDYQKAQLEADPEAFAADKPTPTFVAPVGNGGEPPATNQGAMYAQQFNAQYGAASTPT